MMMVMMMMVMIPEARRQAVTLWRLLVCDDDDDNDDHDGDDKTFLFTCTEAVYGSGGKVTLVAKVRAIPWLSAASSASSSPLLGDDEDAARCHSLRSVSPARVDRTQPSKSESFALIAASSTGCVQLVSWYERPARCAPLDVEGRVIGLWRLQIVNAVNDGATARGMHPGVSRLRAHRCELRFLFAVAWRRRRCGKVSL